ncbi:ROK family protein [Actinoplanes sp. NPDC051859]|uniref:ROK family transcriptional regulator n=1 Tax=Actinoplanes sp. NPDC051859 TaxID=3363909 RepID=UPI0037918C9E
MTRLAGSSKLLRAMNASAALAHLFEQGRLTRSDLRKLTDLSTPTISEVLRRLTDAGLVSVVGYHKGRPGPNAEIYAVDPTAAYAAAVSVRDIGTSRAPAIVAALCDLTGTVRARIEHHVDFLRTDPCTAISEAVTTLRAKAGVDADSIHHVQLAIAGSYDTRAETIRHVEIPGLGRPGLIPETAAALGTQVGVDNDVNLAAVAERRRGAGRDADSFALLWLGQDGLGLAIDIAGTLMRGARGGAGEIGYMPLYAPGSTHRKIDLQDLIGGAAIMALGRDHNIPGTTPADIITAATTPTPEPPALRPATPDPAAPHQPTSDAAAPHQPTSDAAVGVAAGPRASEFVGEFADRIAVGLAAVIAVLDPSLVVLAGPIAQAGGDPLLAAVQAALERAAPLESTISRTSVTDDAVLLGALDAGLTAVREDLIAAIRDNQS